MSGQYVVASYVLDVDSTLNATQPYSYSYSYYYQDARINLVGRGFLGYSAVTEADPQRQGRHDHDLHPGVPVPGQAADPRRLSELECGDHVHVGCHRAPTEHRDLDLHR
jgi:hypothetical protein